MAVAPYDRWARDYDRRWRQYTAETLTALQLPVKVYHRAVRVGLMVGCAARPTQWEGCIRPLSLAELDRAGHVSGLIALYVPPLVPDLLALPHAAVTVRATTTSAMKRRRIYFSLSPVSV